MEDNCLSETEALHLIKNAEHDTDHKKFLRARDLSVLEFYIREYVESGSQAPSDEGDVSEAD